MKGNDMSLESIFEELEGKQFAAEMRVIAGFKVLLGALEDDYLVQQLISLLSESDSAREYTISRISKLLSENDEPDYLHPFDGAIAGYLFALNAVDPKQAHQVSQVVLDTPQLWWSRRLANRISKEFNLAMQKHIYDAGQSDSVFIMFSLEAIAFEPTSESEADDKSYLISEKIEEGSEIPLKFSSDLNETGNSILETIGIGFAYELESVAP